MGSTLGFSLEALDMTSIKVVKEQELKEGQYLEVNASMTPWLFWPKQQQCMQSWKRNRLLPIMKRGYILNNICYIEKG